MATVTLDQLAGDAITITANLRVAEPDGINSVNINDNMGFPIEPRNPIENGQCPDKYEFSLGIILRSRLPLEVVVTDCSNQTDPPFIVGEPASPIDSDPIRLSCSPLFSNPPSAMCLQNLDELRVMRRQFERLCRRKSQAQFELALAIAAIITGFLMIALGVAIAAAGSVGGIFGFILIALGVAMMAAGVAFMVSGERARRLATRQLAEINQEIGSLRPEFEDKSSEVTDTCCRQHIDVSLSIPCDADGPMPRPRI